MSEKKRPKKTIVRHRNTIERNHDETLEVRRTSSSALASIHRLQYRIATSHSDVESTRYAAAATRVDNRITRNDQKLFRFRLPRMKISKTDNTT